MSRREGFRRAAFAPYGLSAAWVCAMGAIPARSEHEVTWVPPQHLGDAPRSYAGSSAQEHTDRVHAIVVVVLTLACTVLALYDLLMLASGA